MRNNDERRQRGHGRDYDYEHGGRDSENWGANRQHGGDYEGRGRSEDQSRDRYPDRWGRHGRPQGSGSEYGDAYGTERFGPRSSGYGGYDGDQAGFDQGGYGRGGGYGVGRFPEDSARYGRQQQPSNYGGGRQGGYNDRFIDDYGSRQRGEQYGRGEDRYSQGFYGDASRFGRGMQQGERESRSHHDPDYQQWRTEQLRSLDNDYEAWRGERYKKFSEDFNTWRSSRLSQSNDSKQQGNSSANKGKDQS